MKRINFVNSTFTVFDVVLNAIIAVVHVYLLRHCCPYFAPFSRDVGRSNKNSDGKIAKNCLMVYGVRRRHQILIPKRDLEWQNHCAFAVRS